MWRNLIACAGLIVGSTAVQAQEAADSDAAAPETVQPAEAEPAAGETVAQAGTGQVKTLSGMSILGNEEAPKSLVIVPWKSSEIGDGLGVDDSIDDRPRPVDREVFLREVHYYELRSGPGD